jgi:hypothetical protein
MLSLCASQHYHEQVEKDKLPQQTLQLVDQLIRENIFEKDIIFSILAEKNIEPKTKKQEIQLKNHIYNVKKKHTC